ncbi:cobalamin synthase [Yersinia enterocolitica]|uniref:Adenosylcobinamide-GDP ribazoletransferase n=1 Tax=Yersinia enterocolitica serotype O:8 / biotype 1B (strain NCTC 13174 / 8081) TaxID=393305 RepID=A1JTQ0_YERE8|nr:adenosylcobinamide-GDP ribazoletransferase [Yersinia enterocolitica]AJJ23183.1 cobalamin 5'-phosphate synthase [Yersinia enterocolitica]EKA28354.1 cobalamin synthase [Yersinia enterocolitica subsp. enterocolitica WA-314]ELI8282550.1 adenosylcobinamide-GDP ribazoletransferase [Yersinia enterocolitica]MCE3128147.1 adenosylcobinamide-GDP ribazoletransferase [Yersinia enterocolitica]PNM11468.1 adenosylcobinamide-GDP ribazoletransferase [Yersinia enterocolitica]
MNLRLFLATLQFMTRIPVPERWTQGLALDNYERGIIGFPFIGLIVGVIGGVVFTLLAPWCGVPLAALGYVLALALVTGAFHLDGLADTCDGVFSARKREQMLEIMRDSRLGTNGGLALIFIVVAKVLVVSELALRDAPMLLMLTAASVAGRTVIVLLMYRQRYAREGNGLGNIYIGKVTGKQTLITLAGGAILTLLLGQGAALLALVISMVVVALLATYLRRRLGGQTGDTLGAAAEVGELIFLLALL